MKGENFTRIGLFLFGIGLILLIVWVILYDEERDPVIHGKIKPQSNSSKSILTAGTTLTAIGYCLSLAGFVIACDVMNFSLKMPKNNLIET